MTYTCRGCGGVFEGGDETKAREEMEFYFPGTSAADRVVLCEECWQMMKPERNPEIYKEWLSKNGR